MLVLSRKRHEVIKIGDDIEISVVEIRGDKVRLGIEAPTEVPVHRKEVYDAIARAEGKVHSGGKIQKDRRDAERAAKQSDKDAFENEKRHLDDD